MKVRRTGFTLIELLVVIAIIAILAAILFPVFARARDQARKTTCTSNLKNLSSAVMMYIQDNDEMYPVWPGMWDAPERWWMFQIMPNVKNVGVFSCPNDTRRFNAWDPNQCDSCGWDFAVKTGSNPREWYQSSYGMSEWLIGGGREFNKTAAVPAPASTAMIADNSGPLFSDWDGCGNMLPDGMTRLMFSNSGEWGWGGVKSMADIDARNYTARHGQQGNVIGYADGHVSYIVNKSFYVENTGSGVCGDQGAPKREKPVMYPRNNPM